MQVFTVDIGAGLSGPRSQIIAWLGESGLVQFPPRMLMLNAMTPKLNTNEPKE